MYLFHTENNPLFSSSSDCNSWIIDCEQVCCLLLGRCIYNRVIGNVNFTETNKWYWLRSDLLYEALVNKVSSSIDSQTVVMGT